jgi:hypothetical protein
MKLSLTPEYEKHIAERTEYLKNRPNYVYMKRLHELRPAMGFWRSYYHPDFKLMCYEMSHNRGIQYLTSTGSFGLVRYVNYVRGYKNFFTGTANVHYKIKSFRDLLIIY